MDLFKNLNGFVESYQKATNPIFDVLPGGQILNAPTSYVLDQIGRHNAKYTNYVDRPEDLGTNQVEPTFKEKLLLGNDAKDVVNQQLLRGLKNKYGKDSKRFGYSLTEEGDKSKPRQPSSVKADSDFYAMPEAREAVARGLSLDPSMDTAQSIARKTQSLDLRERFEELGGEGAGGTMSDAKLKSQIRQLERKDKRASAVFDAGTEIDVEAKSLGLGEGATPEEIRAKKAANFAEDYRAKDALYEASGKGIREQESHKSGLAVNAQNIASARNADTLANAQFVENRRINDRQFNYNKFADDRNFRQRVLEGNQALDMRKFELEMQRDMSEDARQTGMINNLLGGLFSLGSLL